MTAEFFFIVFFKYNLNCILTVLIDYQAFILYFCCTGILFYRCCHNTFKLYRMI